MISKTTAALLIIVALSGWSIAKENFDLTYEELLTREIQGNLENDPNQLDKPYVIMVSLDGYRHDYAELHGANQLLNVVENGARVKNWMPCFPSKTFPNHYSIATGLYPAHHGIVANTFYSREKDAMYAIRDRSKVEDGSWYGGVPIWNLAQQQGMLSASFFWVGSEADINGMHPNYHYKFDGSVPYKYRVRRVLEWLDLPELKRPHMLTLYFSMTDTCGHKYGPEADETCEAVQIVDSHIKTLREGIEKSGLPVTLIVTSDHGMTDITEAIYLEDYTDLKDNTVLHGPFAFIYTTDESETERLYNDFIKTDDFRTYLSGSLPSYLHYDNPDRLGDLVLLAEAPAQFNKKTSEPYSIAGNHGFDPFTTPDMGGILYMEGPRIKKGSVVDAVENIHLYPLIAELLELKIDHPIDGRLEVLKPLITD